MNNTVVSYVAQGAFNITPSADQIPQCRAFTIRCGSAGNLVVKGVDGVDVTINGVLAGETIPLIVTHVLPATTVTNIVGYKMFTDIR